MYSVLPNQFAEMSSISVWKWMKVNSVRKRKKSKFQELVTSHSQKVKDRKVESPTLTGRDRD